MIFELFSNVLHQVDEISAGNIWVLWLDFKMKFKQHLYKV